MREQEVRQTGRGRSEIRLRPSCEALVKSSSEALNGGQSCAASPKRRFSVRRSGSPPYRDTRLPPSCSRAPSVLPGGFVCRIISSLLYRDHWLRPSGPALSLREPCHCHSRGTKFGYPLRRKQPLQGSSGPVGTSSPTWIILANRASVQYLRCSMVLHRGHLRRARAHSS